MSTDNARFPECVAAKYSYRDVCPYGSGIMNIYWDNDLSELEVRYEDTDGEHKIGEDDTYYWLAYLLWWYDTTNEVAWTMADFYRAAQACEYVDAVLPIYNLTHLCGITTDWNVGPDPWDVVKKRIDDEMFRESYYKEGAD